MRWAAEETALLAMTRRASFPRPREALRKSLDVVKEERVERERREVEDG